MVPYRKTENQTFVDDYVDLTGGIWKGCRFDGCIVELRSGYTPTTIANCVFEECKLVGDGWPPGLPIPLDPAGE